MSAVSPRPNVSCATIWPNSPHSPTGSPSNPQPDTKTTLAQRNPGWAGAGAYRSQWGFSGQHETSLSPVAGREVIVADEGAAGQCDGVGRASVPGRGFWRCR